MTADGGGEVEAFLLRARNLLESAEAADPEARLKALEDLHGLLEEELDRIVEQNPPRQ